MAPAFFIEFDPRAGRRPRGIGQVARVAALARHSGGATAAGVVAIPRLPRMVLADPAAVLALRALHDHTKRNGSESCERSTGSCRSTKS
jgi:hypothetical protein